MKRLLEYFIVCASFIVLIAAPTKVYSQTDSLYISYGNATGQTMNVEINQRLNIPVYIFTGANNHVADLHLPLGTMDKYVDSLLSETEGELYYPLTEWDGAYFTEAYGSPPNPEGWSAHSLMGWARFYPTSESPWFISLGDYMAAKFVIKTANDSLNIGDDVLALCPGLNPYQGPSNAGDTLAEDVYIMVETFPMFHFNGGGYLEGTIIDIADNPIEGINVTVEETGKQTSTDSEGDYHMGHYPFTDFTLIVDHPDYASHSVTITVYENEHTYQDFVLNMLGIISGTVTDYLGDPISDIEVIIGEQSVYTGLNGVYEFRGLEPDDYDVTFSHSDYFDTVSYAVTAAYDSVSTLDMTLHMPGGISGTVTFAGNDDPVGGIQVSILGQPSIMTITDSLGFYSLEIINPGSYDIYFEDPMLVYDEDTVTNVTVGYDIYTDIDLALDFWTGIDDNDNLPGSFALKQNYPNPFNATTTIEYNIKQDSRVTLDIYDILGRKVVTLVDEDQNAGAHRVVWKAGSSASGMYFYRIHAGDEVEQKSMMLLK